MKSRKSQFILLVVHRLTTLWMSSCLCVLAVMLKESYTMYRCSCKLATNNNQCPPTSFKRGMKTLSIGNTVYKVLQSPTRKSKPEFSDLHKKCSSCKHHLSILFQIVLQIQPLQCKFVYNNTPTQDQI